MEDMSSAPEAGLPLSSSTKIDKSGVLYLRPLKALMVWCLGTGDNLLLLMIKWGLYTTSYYLTVSFRHFGHYQSMESPDSNGHVMISLRGFTCSSSTHYDIINKGDLLSLTGTVVVRWNAFTRSRMRAVLLPHLLLTHESKFTFLHLPPTKDLINLLLKHLKLKICKTIKLTCFISVWNSPCHAIWRCLRTAFWEGYLDLRLRSSNRRMA
jgi:hypothetical protein